MPIKNIGKPPLKTVAALALAAALPAFAGPEEDELARISKVLKPISDSQWNEVTAPLTSDTYEVQKGDNLWNISKTLFGNAFYWPKVWTFNNSDIGNPHLIAPGQKLTFRPGSSEGMPTLKDSDSGSPSTSAAGDVSAAEVAKDEKKALEHEYDKLSPELYAPEEGTASAYDESGFERDLRVAGEARFNFRVPALVNESTIPHLGEITASRRDGAGLGTGEIVFVKSSGQDLQVGSLYSVLSEPIAVSDKRSDRAGYSYTATGEVRIVGVKDGTYIAEVIRASDVLRRGSRIYPLLPLIGTATPKTARAPIESLVLLDPSTSVSNVSQHRYVFFDRGLEDGVEIGNVFRIYDYYDPVTQKKITDSDFLVSADAIVVHATAQYSTALIIRGLGTVSKGDFGILLTDISDLEKRQRSKAKVKDINGEEEREGDKELDELDELDRKAVGEGLGRQEELEVKELDQWDRTKDLEPTVPSDAGSPGDEELPPTAPPSTGQPPEMEAAPLEPLEGGTPPAQGEGDTLDSGSVPEEPLEAQ